MKLVSLSLIIGSILYLVEGQQTQPACASRYTRREVRGTSASDWSMISSTFLRMQSSGWVGWFAYLHTINFNSIHGNSMFFPFHRKFVQDFESIGRRSFNSRFYVPYWDSARDYVAPQNSAVLSSRYIGGNGGGNGCLTNGLQGNSIMTYPNRHCLRRVYNGPGNTIRTWYSPEFILSRLLNDRTMAALRSDIEYSIHGAVHVGLGGDMNTRASANDFAFFMHHCNLDRLWWRWQLTGNKIWVMDGPGPNGAASINTSISHYNIPMRNVMQLGFGDMCFNYDDAAPLTGGTTPAASRVVAAAPADTTNTGSASENAAASNLSNQVGSSSSASGLFPGITNTNSSLTRRGLLPSKFNPNKKCMPRPGPIDLSWVRMHNFDINEVDKVYDTACNLVDTLNDIGYLPLYV